MTFDIGLHEVCVRTGVRYVITKFSGMDSLLNFLTHGAPVRAREGARELRYQESIPTNRNKGRRQLGTLSVFFFFHPTRKRGEVCEYQYKTSL